MRWLPSAAVRTPPSTRAGGQDDSSYTNSLKLHDASARPQTIVFKSHMNEESWSRHHGWRHDGGGIWRRHHGWWIVEETSWREAPWWRHLEEASWRRHHGRDSMEETSWREASWRRHAEEASWMRNHGYHGGRHKEWSEAALPTRSSAASQESLPTLNGADERLRYRWEWRQLELRAPHFVRKWLVGAHGLPGAPQPCWSHAAGGDVHGSLAWRGLPRAAHHQLQMRRVF